ncbi:hypothetical protein [Pseudomonas phage vB_PaeM_PS119XW]|uniref:Uncharacterized protein n=2 Tax=root TaxID=1 RepID=A0A5C1K946_9CAUD|nr:hypothetical protein PP933_gp145 [Pseudomonas phage vB_PaeM_PS119XW]QEM41874.1 hypothetical protein [Pseudomonas phage vB_PaeM_PS119XW]
MYNQQAQLPVSCQQVDQSTFNGNLPHGNDRVPQLQLSQNLMNNQQLVLMAIGLFRGLAQSSVGKSNLHIFAYNLLSSNWFQNQIFQQWCQHLVDFVEFLCVCKNYSQTDAPPKAAQRMYEAFLGQCVASYPALVQMGAVPQHMFQGLQTAQAMYQQILQEIQAYKSGNYRPQQQQMGMMGQPQGIQMAGNLPPINPGNMGQFATTTQATFSQPAGTYGAAPNTVSSTTSSYYDDTPAASAPLMPKEEISTDIYGGYSHQQEQQPMYSQQPQVQNTPVVEDTDLPVPIDVSQVMIDPMYYQPTGFRVNIARPYDEIHNPGGILIKPAQLVDWERTVGDEDPYSPLVDPEHYCRFFVKFPDGVVKEKFIEWNPQMEYLKHELNDDLRRREYRPNGVVYASTTPISTIGGDAMGIEEVESLVKDNELGEAAAMRPIILDNKMFMGANDLENESEARAAVRELLNIGDDEESQSITLPAHEYKSMSIYHMDVSDETFEQLSNLRNYTDLIGIATELKEMVNRGQLSIRYFRFLNDRLTDSINDFMADSLSIQNITISDFAHDIGDLLDYISNKKGTQVLQIIKACAAQIIARSVTMAEVDDIRGVADQYVNFQVGWTLEQMATLNVLTEKAVLVSEGTHPTVREVLKGMITRATASGLANVRMRLITVDGVYMEVIRGRLTEKAVLLKRLK